MTICTIIEWLAILWMGSWIVFLTGYSIMLALIGIGTQLKRTLLKLKGE